MENKKYILNKLFDKIEECIIFEDGGFEYRKENGVLYSRQDKKEEWTTEDWEGTTSDYNIWKKLFESFID